MKNKYTFTTYFRENWWPIIKELLIMILSISLILAIIIFALIILDYFHKNNPIIFYSIITLIVIFLIISAIYFDYQNCKKEYYKKQNTINKKY